MYNASILKLYSNPITVSFDGKPLEYFSQCLIKNEPYSFNWYIMYDDDILKN